MLGPLLGIWTGVGARKGAVNTMPSWRTMSMAGSTLSRQTPEAAPDGCHAKVRLGRAKPDLEDHGPVTIEQRLSAAGVGVRTVGDLIERLSDFDSTAPVRVQHSLSSLPEFIIGVGESPDVHGVVAIVYLPPPSRPAG